MKLKGSLGIGGIHEFAMKRTLAFVELRDFFLERSQFLLPCSIIGP